MARRAGGFSAPIKVPNPPKVKLLNTHVATPRVSSMSNQKRFPGYGLFPHVTPPRLPRLSTNLPKGITHPDASQFGTSGFGNTGLTGES